MYLICDLTYSEAFAKLHNSLRSIRPRVNYWINRFTSYRFQEIEIKYVGNEYYSQNNSFRGNRQKG